MINIEDIKIGQKVWYQEFWSQRVVFAYVNKITTINNSENKYIVQVKGDVKDDESIVRTVNLPLHCFFTTKDEVIAMVEQKNLEIVNKYKSEINTIADLIKFPLIHPFGAEEYTDYEAIKAYKEKAAELGFKNLNTDSI